MRKVQFGCGGNRLAGWENYDYEVDISKKLPFEDASVDAVLAEHVLEHISIQEAWSFLEECMRIMKNGAYLRIAVPSVTRIHAFADEEYFKFIKAHGWGEATRKDAVKSIIFNHGHQTIWEQSSLYAIIDVLGFEICATAECMKDTLHHQKVIGDKINNIETVVVDCQKK